MDKTLAQRLAQITDVGIGLCDSLFARQRAALDFLAVHCKDDSERRYFDTCMEHIATLWEITPRGNTYLLKQPFEHAGEKVSFVKIRTPDPKSTFIGECDFILKDWLGFSTQNRHAKWMEFIEKENSHLLKYADPQQKVILYFTNPPLSERRAASRQPIIAIQALIIRDNQILITREGDRFLLPGGKPEAGENHEQTLRRELMEETTLRLQKAEYFATYSFPKGPYTERPLTLICYICTVNGEPKQSSETEELIWITQKEYKNESKWPKLAWEKIFTDLKEQNLLF